LHSQCSFILLSGSCWDNERSPYSYCTVYRLHISMVRKRVLPPSSVTQLVKVDANVIRWKKCDAVACRLKLFQRLPSSKNASQWKLRNPLSDYSLIFSGRSLLISAHKGRFVRHNTQSGRSYYFRKFSISQNSLIINLKNLLITTETDLGQRINTQTWAVIKNWFFTHYYLVGLKT
jgi:hypothetical protein